MSSDGNTQFSWLNHGSTISMSRVDIDFGTSNESSRPLSLYKCYTQCTHCHARLDISMLEVPLVISKQNDRPSTFCYSALHTNTPQQLQLNAGEGEGTVIPPPNVSALWATQELDSSKNLKIRETSMKNPHIFQLAVQIKMLQENPVFYLPSLLWALYSADICPNVRMLPQKLKLIELCSIRNVWGT